MKGPATPYEWRKGVVQGFDSQIEYLQRERDEIQSRLDEIIKLRDANKAVELKRPYKAKETAPQGPVKKKRKLSPEGLARVRAANKKMWAKRRKEKK